MKLALVLGSLLALATTSAYAGVSPSAAPQSGRSVATKSPKMAKKAPHRAEGRKKKKKGKPQGF